MIRIEHPEDCCGCTACASICSHDAISMKPDTLGFLYPEVDMEKCVDCGLCEKVCAFNDNYDTSLNLSQPDVYAARHKDMQEIETSRSGAAFIALSDWVIEHGGVVYGAGYTDHFRVVHKRATTKEARNEFKGSKYVQSDIKNTFNEAKKYLDSGRKVLFVGTPCQISGLNAYLGKQYNNLLTVDFVCHGVPSPKLFKNYLKWEARGKNITDFRFRSKLKKGWGLCYSYRIENKLKHGSVKMNPYYNAFLNGYTYRECCYNCKYATKQRISDITLCDYWGIEKEHPEFYDSKGVSGIIINTQKGNQIFKQIQKKLIYIESTFDKLKRKNHNLENPAIRPEIRDTVYDGIFDKDFNIAIKENLYFRKRIVNNLKYLIPESLKNKIRK